MHWRLFTPPDRDNPRRSGGRVLRRHSHVALANKLARIAWVILTRGETYQPYKQAA
jgi:hypothetical protein